MACDGGCCVVFSINNTLDRARAGGHRIDVPVVRDGDMLGFMLREITREEAQARAEKFGVGMPEDLSKRLYKCIYWNEDTRLCGAYENRPAMCSEYPYPLSELHEPERMHAGKCDHGCDCKGAPLVWLGD